MKANDHQVGGSHYGLTKLQHWDLSRIFNWDGFQHAITKYVMRWRDKYDTPGKRKEDLLKAKHMLEKYLEDFEVWDQRAHPEDYERKTPVSEGPQIAMFHEKCGDVPVPAGWQIEGFFGDCTMEWKCLECKERFRGSTPPPDHHHAELVSGFPPIPSN